MISPLVIVLYVGFTMVTESLTSTPGVDCEAYVADPTISRIDKIYRCLGSARNIPRPTVYQVCPQIQKVSGMVQMNGDTSGTRPIQDDISYQFQQVDQQRTITGDILSTTAGLSFNECSMACTDNPLCQSFAHKADNTCIVSSTCNPSGTPEVGTSMYNIAVWYSI